MSASCKRPCVLLVDDNMAVRKAINLLVTSLGWHATEAAHANDAIEQLQKRHYDLAIIDINMPGTNGIELCRSICANATSPAPMVIILSGYVDSTYHQAALAAGAKEVLEKPLGRDGFIEAFKKLGLPCEA